MIVLCHLFIIFPFVHHMGCFYILAWFSFSFSFIIVIVRSDSVTVKFDFELQQLLLLDPSHSEIQYERMVNLCPAKCIVT
jgi:hypothetical protein